MAEIASAVSPARERILEAAERVVGDVGAARMTLEGVAQAAGVSKGGLLYHFPTKEALTEAMIERLVRGFYAKVRQDAVLAPIFDARIRDWEPHLEQMFAFWSSVAAS